MLKRPFYIVTKPNAKYSMYYRTRNLRHQLIKLNIERFGYSEDMPDGEWIVTFTWRFKNAFGLRFREA